MRQNNASWMDRLGKVLNGKLKNIKKSSTLGFVLSSSLVMNEYYKINEAR